MEATPLNSWKIISLRLYLNHSFEKCNDALCWIIARLANLSFKVGSFQARFKVAQITPLIKIFGHESGEPVSCRPISYLKTIGKLFDRL